MQGLPLRFQLLGSARVADMRAEVRLFARSPAAHNLWIAPSNILTFRFAPRDTSWTRSVSKRTEFLPCGPLTFRPRSSSWETKSNGAPVLHVMAAFDSTLSPAGQFEEGPCSVDDLSMIELMRQLHDEIRSPGFASEAMLESIFEMLRIKLCRLGQKTVDVGGRGAGFGKSDIALIHDYIEAQSGRSPSVSELAKLFDMSRRSLLRRFKSATSMTVTNYITEVQVTKAKRLLGTSDALIKQVAHETGFKSPSNFTLAFERSVGMTPSAYRNLSRGA